MGKALSFGARECRSIRRRLFRDGVAALPRSWTRHSWIIARIRATPEWADFKEIRKFYAKAVQLTEETGVPHTVDHIIPLQHLLVSGLHCEFNLRVVTDKVNAAKSNSFAIDQLELFERED